VYGRSLKRYPPDCPPLQVQWFHAVDVSRILPDVHICVNELLQSPKRKPEWLKGKKIARDPKPLPPPKKYMAFSTEDSRSIEAAYQKILEEAEDLRTSGSRRQTLLGSGRKGTVGAVDAPNTSLGNGEDETQTGRSGARVPVNEDFLFDVDIDERELAPAYWLGPVYDVRRGSWFHVEASGLRACEENLASQLEEGYLKTKPWLYPSKARVEPVAQDVTPKASVENLKSAAMTSSDAGKMAAATTTAQHQPQSHRLFGTYMNQIATYHDASTVFLSTEGMLSWVTSTVYERFSGGGYMNGMKLVRGYSEPSKTKETKRPSTPTGTRSTTEPEEKDLKMLKRRSAPPSTRTDAKDETSTKKDEPHPFESRGSRLQRQLSSLMESAESRSPAQKEEAIRREEEDEIQHDYNAQAGETQGREVEHLVLVTHGIGQLLGFRYVPYVLSWRT
jgi:hypothetical protein